MNETRTVLEFETANENETRAIGLRIGELIEGGTLVGLDGELGSGKTRLVQGMACGLGIPADEVTSPTFVLCHIYEGRLNLWHVDAYRLNHVAEYVDLGIDEALEQGASVVVEWSERVAAALPGDRLQIQLVELDVDRRRITIGASGPRSRNLLSKWGDAS